MITLAADLERHPEVARLRGPLAGAAKDAAVYLVGGAVRDLLLGAAHVDVDLVVDGDAVAVARRLAQATGERLVVYDSFGTATVGDVDLATARTERYAEPGALPDVRVGLAGRRPGASRLLDQRDRRIAGAPARSATSPIRTTGSPMCSPASSACCTTRRSATTRRG